jgi:hypothetical protein
VTRRGDPAWAALGAGGLGLLLVAAAAGPVGLVSGQGRPFEFLPPPPPTTPPPDAAENKTLREATRGVEQVIDLSWLGQLIIWSIFVALGLGVVLALVQLWRDREGPAARRTAVDFDVLPAAALAEALRDDAAEQLAAVREGDPRNGIVACWLRLEDAVGAAGMPRRSWETSAEFTVRILHRLDLDPAAIGALSRLYREARFSDHPLGEESRAAAETALGRLHTELADLS